MSLHSHDIACGAHFLCLDIRSICHEFHQLGLIGNFFAMKHGVADYGVVHASAMSQYDAGDIIASTRMVSHSTAGLIEYVCRMRAD